MEERYEKLESLKKHLFIIILFLPDLLALVGFFYFSIFLLSHSLALFMPTAAAGRRCTVSTIYDRVVCCSLAYLLLHNTASLPDVVAAFFLLFAALLHSYDNKKNWIIFLVHFKALTKAHRDNVDVSREFFLRDLFYVVWNIFFFSCWSIDRVSRRIRKRLTIFGCWSEWEEISIFYWKIIKKKKEWRIKWGVLKKPHEYYMHGWYLALFGGFSRVK